MTIKHFTFYLKGKGEKQTIADKRRKKLEKLAQKERISKGQVLRDLIDRDFEG